MPNQSHRPNNPSDLNGTSNQGEQPKPDSRIKLTWKGITATLSGNQTQYVFRAMGWGVLILACCGGLAVLLAALHYIGAFGG